ncbi:MAG: hypothetical protein V1913_13050 [Fibrobacterota bacterium]
MKTDSMIAVLAVLLTASFAFAEGAGKRNFIGTNLNYITPESYTPAEGCSLVFYDNFDDNKFNDSWEKFGSLDYYAVNRQVKVPVRTLKMEPKEGSLLQKKSVDCRVNPVRLTVDATLPTRNNEISSAILFFPEEAAIDNQGLPETFVRYFKRSQMEMVEAKEKNQPLRLLYARNNKTESGAPRRCVLQIDAKNISLAIDDKPVFSGPHDMRNIMSVRSGLWTSTKGTSHSGGNIVFDNFILESVTADEEPKEGQ